MIETPTFGHAAVAAPHHLASEAGRNVLVQGGNALEAMVAMAATIAVVYPHMNSMGGDGFWLMRTPKGRYYAIEACGPAGALATRKRYLDKGYDAIPVRGADAALTVAGAVAGWRMALDLAASLGARLPLPDLLSDALKSARNGYAVSASEARTKPKELAGLHDAPGFRATFLDDKGLIPAAGTLRCMPALAETLAQLAHAGLDDFYRGDVGREIAGDLSRIGAPITRDDLASFRATMREPLTLKLDDVTLANFPPPTQGLASLVLLGVFEQLQVKKSESFAHIHGLIEATKRAMMIRDRVITDPAFAKHDPTDWLTLAALEREASLISQSRAAPWPAASEDGDTIWMGAIDSDGLAVSYIQSIYWEYGSGCVLPGTGLLWQNRGLSFSLDTAGRNPLMPGRKPFHTLNPAMAAFNDGRVMSYGSMGGDGQPQFQAQIFTRAARFGQGLASAIDAPRFLLGKTWGSTSTTLKLENRFDPSLLSALRKAGHEVEEIDLPYADSFGHAGMLIKHPRDGRVEASHDPRSDGSALGI
jgi:oxamate amidohydrolase